MQWPCTPSTPDEELPTFVTHVLRRYIRRFPGHGRAPHGSYPEPTIHLHEWVRYLVERSGLGSPVFIGALVLLRRLLRARRDAYLARHNARRLFLVASIVASKVLEDRPPSNRQWVQVALHRYPLALINAMEMEFLEAIDFRSFFSREDIARFVPRIRVHAPRLAAALIEPECICAV